MGIFQDKVAVITGGASGIGAATARLMVQEGGHVIIADMQEERGRALAEELGSAAQFSYVEVRDEDLVKGAVDQAVAAWGRLDCMFNNAGFGGVLGPIEDIPAEEFELTMDVLVKGVFLGMKHAIPALKQTGGGAIINTGSIAGITAGRGPLIYSTAKAAVVHLSKVSAMQLGQYNIRVNALCPGYIVTPLSMNTVGKPDALMAERHGHYTDLQPIPRAGMPEDIAEMAVFLASDKASFVSGQAITVDGGVATGALWKDQKEVYKSYHPTSVYRPADDT